MIPPQPIYFQVLAPLPRPQLHPQQDPIAGPAAASTMSAAGYGSISASAIGLSRRLYSILRMTST
jgi:hypothetical protein